MRLLLTLSFCLSIIIRQANSSSTPTPVVNCHGDNLLNALRASGHLSDSYHFCSAYLSIPPTTTATVYTSTCVLSSYVEVETIVHPLYLYNLQPLFTSPTPLTYNSKSPTPSPIPGGAENYGLPRVAPHRQKRDLFSETLPTPPPSPPQQLVRRGSPAVPSYIATTYPASRLSSACSCLSVPAASTKTVSQGLFSIDITTTCTKYVPTTVATYAALCAPSLQVNAPSPNSHPNYEVVPSFPVASKMDCCAACTSVFNCVWWKFSLGTPGDGWQPGTCHYAYYIGLGGDNVDESPQICPNGITSGISNYTPQFGREANNNDPGYNFGPCGGGYNLYESNEDDGVPDDAYEHYCDQPGNQPTASPPGCA